MLSMDGSGNEDDEDVKQLAKFKKQLGYFFESASGISEMTSRSAPILSIKPSPSVEAMNPVAVKAAAHSNRQLGAASTKKKSNTYKKAVSLGKDENKDILVSNDNTWQTALTQLQYPSPMEPVPLISTIHHLFEANRYPERTV